ncbi:MAG: hypothetical protein Q9167_001392 [Letrouitia subvulpina]
MPEPGNFNPTIAQTLADEARDTAFRHIGEVRRKLAVRASWLRARVSQMRTGGRTVPWWGSGVRDTGQSASEGAEQTASQTATTGPPSVSHEATFGIDALAGCA